MVVPAIGIQKWSTIKSMSCSIFSQGKMWALLRLVWLMRILHFPFHLAPPLHYQVRLGIFLNKTKEEQFLHFLSYDLIFKQGKPHLLLFCQVISIFDIQFMDKQFRVHACLILGLPGEYVNVISQVLMELFCYKSLLMIVYKLAYFTFWSLIVTCWVSSFEVGSFCSGQFMTSIL